MDDELVILDQATLDSLGLPPGTVYRALRWKPRDTEVAVAIAPGGPPGAGVDWRTLDVGRRADEFVMAILPLLPPHGKGRLVVLTPDASTVGGPPARGASFSDLHNAGMAHRPWNISHAGARVRVLPGRVDLPVGVADVWGLSEAERVRLRPLHFEEIDDPAEPTPPRGMADRPERHGTKIGGNPMFRQPEIEAPACDRCGGPVAYLAQLEGDLFVHECDGVRTFLYGCPGALAGSCPARLAGQY